MISVSPAGMSHRIPDLAQRKLEDARIAEKARRFRQKGCQVVAVQGLGFVGSAVVAVVADAKNSAARPRFYVIGVDLPTPESYWKVAELGAGRAPVVSLDRKHQELIRNAVKINQNLDSSASEEIYSLADIIVVDVPLGVRDRFIKTPSDIKIDFEGFKKAVQAIGKTMRPRALVIVETTLPVGTCANVVIPLLKKERARRGIKSPLLLSYAYERVMPGRHYVDSLKKYWRTLAGIDKKSVEKTREFLSSFIETKTFPMFELEDIESAEIAKSLENSYRAANIAFIHEWTLLAEKTGVNLFAVIDSIRVRKGTHDNIRFPGFGVGGYCLTKDALLAQWGLKHFFKSGHCLETSLKALWINNEMPEHTLDLIRELAGSLKGKKIVVCGVSYLADVSDTRHSPAELLVNLLIKSKAVVVVHDPSVRVWNECPGIKVQQDLAKSIEGADGIVFTTPHQEYAGLSAKAILGRAGKKPFLVDAQNIINDKKAEELRKRGCRLSGVGKGHWRKKNYHVAAKR